MSVLMPKKKFYPRLIQRGIIVKPLVNSNTFYKSVTLDYMGSAEFESWRGFDGLPASRTRILQAPVLYVRPVSSIKQDASPLYVMSYLSDDEFLEYEKVLYNLRYMNPEYQLKEVSYFSAHKESYGRDFWWDIINDVIWSFNKEYMDGIINYMTNN